MTPIRVAIGLMAISGLFGWLIGLGASPFLWLVLPLIATGMIQANRGLRR